MSIPCPCCGNPIASLTPEKAANQLSPLLSAIVRLLAARPGEYLSSTDLATSIWRHDPNGGPEKPGDRISDCVGKGRLKLARYGWYITSRPGAGGYKLEACTPVDLRVIPR